MAKPIVCKIAFTVTFPVRYERRGHVSARKMHCLATHQLSNLEIIQTIDHLFECPTCLDAYRFIRSAVLQDCK